MRIILGDKFNGYQKSLNILQLDTLKNRRENLCLNFAQKCLKNPKTKDMFPENNKAHKMLTRNQEKFKVEHAKTTRFRNSAVIYMQNLLNKQNL